ncbi:hypothetical protein TWF192_002934 [Orbilia oligospora]|uniref:Carboxypeptidase M14A n=1 Tax=Orbilia oligospora TaxID=2813651 RepID=A0A6G1MD99_ORBOL|nr:hypothetical protein TWF679_007594 [Orbilia oligospora]KAF3254851.1 hypothetical protein TWF192_002934 [Orbilia oligospora]
MYFSKTQILAILAFTGAVAASPVASVKKVNHSGTRVVRLQTHTEEDIAVIKSLVDNLYLDTWTHGYNVNSHVDVAIPPSAQSEFDRISKKAGLNVEVMHEDLGASIEAESPVTVSLASSSRLAIQAANAPDPNWFTAYHAYGYHQTYLYNLATSYPNNAEIVVAGQSTEGREIVGIHIWGKQKGKPAIVLHSNVHAREWITSKVTEYFATKLLQAGTVSNATAAISSMLDSYDYFIFPVVNPDGFVYSQTTDRMWRKNRLRLSSNSCIGTDVNRNWDYKWSSSGGASTNPCAQDFKGLGAGDTAEYKGLSGFLKDLVNTVGVKLFIDYHSYSQLILSPWGYTCNTPAPDEAEHLRVMKIWEAGMRRRYKTSFTYGPSCTTIYPTTGDSTDYTYGALNITHSYSVELRDTGRYGFVLPANQIIPSGEEAFDGFQDLVHAL